MPARRARLLDEWCAERGFDQAAQTSANLPLPLGIRPDDRGLSTTALAGPRAAVPRRRAPARRAHGLQTRAAVRAGPGRARPPAP